MSFTPPTPTMYTISLSPTHVNNAHIPSPPISSIPSIYPAPCQPRNQLSRLPNTHTLTTTCTCNINIQAMPLPPPRLWGMQGPAGGENKKRRSTPKQEMHQQGPIRGLYQSGGSPAENLGGAACWLADQSGSCVITGQEVRGNQERLRGCTLVHVCVRFGKHVCVLPWLNERNLEEIRVTREDAAEREIK